MLDWFRDTTYSFGISDYGAEMSPSAAPFWFPLTLGFKKAHKQVGNLKDHFNGMEPD